MKTYHISNMHRGWFIGNFSPSIYETELFEVAVKQYKKGDYEKKHHHKIAHEITFIIKGIVIMNNKKFAKGSIITLAPGESCDFKCITNEATTVVVKTPSVPCDKYVE